MSDRRKSDLLILIDYRYRGRNDRPAKWSCETRRVMMGAERFFEKNSNFSLPTRELRVIAVAVAGIDELSARLVGPNGTGDFGSGIGDCGKVLLSIGARESHDLERTADFPFRLARSRRRCADGLPRRKKSGIAGFFEDWWSIDAENKLSFILQVVARKYVE